MQNTPPPNYPDILGYITEGQSVVIGNAVEVAVAARPRQVMAGRPFAVVALLQNLIDVSVEVMAVLQLPQKDKHKMADRFQATSETMHTTIYPAEVGYMILPVNCKLATAHGDGYSLSVEFYVKPKGKGRRIRHNAQDDVEATLSYYFYLTEFTLERISQLKALNFSGTKRGFLANKGIEAEFDVKQGKDWKTTKQQPSWVSLWTLSEHTDARVLLERYGNVLLDSIIPKVQNADLYEPLAVVTQQRLSAGGYDLHPAEAHYIIKLMMALLQLANDNANREHYSGEHIYRVARMIRKGWNTDGNPIPLPQWCKVLLDRLDFDEYIADQPGMALAGPFFGDLMYDAVVYGFHMLQQDTGVDFGTDDEIHRYARQIVEGLWSPEPMLGVVEIYLPLVLGGVLVDENVLIENENKLDNLHTILDILAQYKDDADEELTVVIGLAEDIIHKILIKYGYRLGRY